MKKNKDLDELFREKLLNYEQEPPAYLMENILTGAESARRKRKMMFWKITGIAAAVLLAFVAGWQFNARNEKEIIPAVTITRQQELLEKAQPATDDTVGQSDAEAIQPAREGKFAQMAGDHSKSYPGSFVHGQDSFPEETLHTAFDDEPALLKPLKNIFGMIQKENEPATALQEPKAVEDISISAEKTIDQQIMEQNQQMILAQNEIRKKGHWRVGAQVSPVYNVSRSSHSRQYASNMLNPSSSSPVDLGGGLSVEYKPGKRWSVQSGVHYSGIGQTSGNSSYSNRNLFTSADFNSDHGIEYFNAPVKIDASTSKMMMNSNAGVIEFKEVPSGIVVGANLEDQSLSSAVVVSDARFIQNFEYIEIPLYMRYAVIDSRFDVEMIGGFSSNLLVGNNAYMESNAGKSLVGSTKDMESLTYSGTLGIGLRYELSRHISLNVEPRIKYYLNSLNSNSSVIYKPYTIGVFTGLSYEF